ncbi:antirestriction protein ArdA [uncultured Sneathiella sp.]|uniref:antirestriction protein ArdA n=1 Tax=uncultured Sneathiella sp. TaxID=879315 RepID=UPI0030EC8A16|tara:strand:- start:8085 stop:8603 length:519 start_codon:yes stop_codon:yes gene_type:complete
MKTQQSEIGIYVACLASYNNGILHGRWIDATQSVDEIHAEITSMLKSSTMRDAEEWAIHDHEGFEGIQVSEFESISRVVELATFVSFHGALGVKLYEHYGSLGDAEIAMNDHYAGEFVSLAHFAQDITEQSVDTPSQLEYYIDWEAMGRDMAINDVLAIEIGMNKVHVFWAH